LYTQYSWLSNRFDNRVQLVVKPCLTNRFDKHGLTTVLNEQLFVQPVVKPGCTSGLTTGLTTGFIVYTNIYRLSNRVCQPVLQQVVSCKWGLSIYYFYEKEILKLENATSNKSLAVAEMGDHLATIDMGRKVEWGGCCAPFQGQYQPRRAGLHQTQCCLCHGLPLYQVVC